MTSEVSEPGLKVRYLSLGPYCLSIEREVWEYCRGFVIVTIFLRQYPQIHLWPSLQDRQAFFFFKISGSHLHKCYLKAVGVRVWLKGRPTVKGRGEAGESTFERRGELMMLTWYVNWSFIARVWKILVLIRRARDQYMAMNHPGDLKAWRGELRDREGGPI